MKKIMLIVTFILCMLITESTFAENVKIEEIIVTGTSTGMPRSVIPASVTVITEKDIKEYYEISLIASRYDTEGFSTIASGSEKDSYENTNVTSRIGIHRAGRTMGITAQLTEARTEIDGFDYTTFAASDDLNNRTNRRWSLLGLK